MGFVYCISVPGWVTPNIVKLGYSSRPESRLKQLGFGSPFPLTLRHIAPGTRETEAALHRAFAVHHAFGEWFDDAEDILENVFHLLKTNRVADAFDSRSGIEQLRSWMLRTGATKTMIAAACGVGEPTIAKILKTGKPGKYRHGIARITDGVVSYHDWDENPFEGYLYRSTKELIAESEERDAQRAEWKEERRQRREHIRPILVTA